MKTIDELWYGNISPFEQKETLEKFEDCMNEMHSITERDAFSYGFRLGVQLMAESFLLPFMEEE